MRSPSVALRDRAVKRRTLNKSKLAKIQIPLPPIEEQKRIGMILDKADNIRRLRREAIALLDQLLR
ncbi:restriction endonuclease subunit S [Gloeocapsa sp. PCC 73106]|uniref:restriction endonuclease subunit S n=1 Tax=Gloeocapsa sp. PCC 73106 TaxID=102232 RepID=UPI0002AC31D7|nr:restriction endonuclease subunit S [Gloeocapsa sp. PCC 73106]ELR97841.1 restriction endonuclease S subunit [Gloeocapsa sp. PCC 73106]